MVDSFHVLSDHVGWEARVDLPASSDWLGAAACTPLMAAALAGRVEAVSMLLRRGANPRLQLPPGSQLSPGWTALDCAAHVGCAGAVALLLPATLPCGVGRGQGGKGDSDGKGGRGGRGRQKRGGEGPGQELARAEKIIQRV